jgi:hypothetical protein
MADNDTPGDIVKRNAAAHAARELKREAADDMLAALRLTRQFLAAHGHVDTACFREVDAAIAKATGRRA